MTSQVPGHVSQPGHEHEKGGPLGGGKAGSSAHAPSPAPGADVELQEAVGVEHISLPVQRILRRQASMFQGWFPTDAVFAEQLLAALAPEVARQQGHHAQQT